MKTKTMPSRLGVQLRDSEIIQPKPKCYSYIRFSTPGQINGDSLRRQTALAEKWANANGHVLDDSLRLQDLGVSGFSGANQTKGSAFGDFMEQVSQGRIVPGSILLVENLDRVSREQVSKSFSTLLDIINAGVKIVTLADMMEYDKDSIDNNSMQLMFSLVILTRGHEESQTKSKRLSAAWEQKRANLDTKKLTSRCPLWLELSEDWTKFNIIPARANIVRRIFEMKRDGIGVFTIMKTLNKEATWLPPGRPKKEAIPGKKQSPGSPPGWRETYINKILRSRNVIGEFQPKKRVKDSKGVSRPEPEGQPIPGYFPAVIPVDLFYTIQEQLEQNQNKGGRNGVVSNLFGHIAKCGYCGTAMAFINKGPCPKGGKYLQCDKARRGIGCVRQKIRYQEFEDLILEFCQGLDSRDILPNNEQLETEANQVRARLTEVRGRLADLETRAKNLTNVFEELADKRVRERIEKSLSTNFDEQEVLAAEEKELDQSLKKISNVREATNEQLNDIKSAIKGEESPIYRSRVRAKLRQLIEQITVYPVGTWRKAIQMELTRNLTPEKKQRIQAKLDAGDYDYRERLAYVIRFATGNWRKIEPNQPGVLTEEYAEYWNNDKETDEEYDTGTKRTTFITWGKDGEPIVDFETDIEPVDLSLKFAPRNRQSKRLNTT